MSKVMSAAVLGALVMFGGAHAAPVSSQPNMLQRLFGGQWYGAIRGEASFLNWKNEYSSDADVDGTSERFSFEPVFGASLAIGHVGDNNWRGEVEAGLIGRFSDSGYGADFKLTIPYVSVNALHDFDNNVFVGAGLGLALPKVDLSWYTFEVDEREFSPKFDLMAGYSHQLDSRVSLEFRYKLSVLFGPDVKAQGISNSGDYWLKTDVGTIFANSFSIGLRYIF